MANQSSVHHSFGYRARTRDLFAKKFRKHGTLLTSTYLKTYHIGQIVDIAGDGSVQKGMPHKYYHGKTGVVWNVTPRAVGVQVNKKVGHRIIEKRLHVRIEHVRHSKCRQDFLNRVKQNEVVKKEAKKSGKRVETKRQPAQPRTGGIIRRPKVETLAPIPFVGLYQ
jgi:large subunit ribosomal protein L21e